MANIQSMRVRSLLSILSLLFTLQFLVSCGESEQANAEETAPISDTLSMGETEADCFQSADIICEEGLIFARLGGYLADVYLTDLPEGATQDSMESGEGYEWISRTLHMEPGRLVIEGEFVDSRESNDTILSNSLINRVRVETPLFRTAKDIRVGSSLSDILSAYPDKEWFATPLPEYRSIQIQTAESHIV